MPRGSPSVTAMRGVRAAMLEEGDRLVAHDAVHLLRALLRRGLRGDLAQLELHQPTREADRDRLPDGDALAGLGGVALEGDGARVARVLRLAPAPRDAEPVQEDVDAQRRGRLRRGHYWRTST